MVNKDINTALTVEFKKRPYLFYFNYYTMMVYILDRDLLNSTLLV